VPKAQQVLAATTAIMEVLVHPVLLVQRALQDLLVPKVLLALLANKETTETLVRLVSPVPKARLDLLDLLGTMAKMELLELLDLLDPLVPQGHKDPRAIPELVAPLV